MDKGMPYSLHLGSDKNKKNSVRASAKNNVSGTTSKSNNAIQNAKQLSRVDKHNYRKYDYNQEDIYIVKGSNSLYEDVKKLYLDLFEEARIKYNEKQRETRKINDYFSHISDNSKNDLACEFIIELGNKKYWNTKDMNFKKKMTNVYKQQVDDLEMLVPNFKIASAIIHFDESSPHMHIVGVPIKEKNKYGMELQVGKSDVFTKDSLKVLQDKMRILCIEEFNKEYGLDNILKRKRKGRNYDYLVSDMDNYVEMQEAIERHQMNIDKVNESSKELEKNTNNIKDIVNDLKNVPLSKNNYILKQEDKDKLEDYLDRVDKTNNDYKTIHDLSVSLKDISTELSESKETIKILQESNNALELRNTNLKNENAKLKEKNKILQKELDNIKELFEKIKNKLNDLYHFFVNKMWGDNEKRDKYYPVAYELYKKNILDEEQMKDILETKKRSTEIDRGSKSKNDDFEL
ncbi:mobilization protein [Clostridium sp. CAG:433]|nr:mobilization protein [Clostridium sp. CAG:433]